MIYEFEFDVYKNDKFVETLYLRFRPVDHTPEELKCFILSSMMEFKTHCIEKGYDGNMYHFRNWMRKHKGVEFCMKSKHVLVRVDM